MLPAKGSFFCERENALTTYLARGEDSRSSLQRELRRISKTLNDVVRKVDQVATKAVDKTKVAASATKKPSRRGQGIKSAPDVIMALIKARKSGVDTATLRAKTGFGGQKVRSIVWDLSKIGKIQGLDRGFYRAVK
jgi:hypothetical protein